MLGGGRMRRRLGLTLHGVGVVLGGEAVWILGDACLINTHKRPSLCGRKLVSQKNVGRPECLCGSIQACALNNRVGKSGGEVVEQPISNRHRDRLWSSPS